MSLSNWRSYANCKGMPISKFFEEYEESVEVQLEVDAVCGNCVVRTQCLEWAVSNGLEGVFGRKFLKPSKKKKKNVYT